MASPMKSSLPSEFQSETITFSVLSQSPLHSFCTPIVKGGHLEGTESSSSNHAHIFSTLGLVSS